MTMPRVLSLSGTDRYNFMLALTGYLITNRQQKIQDVAAHFQVTEKDIRSAVVTISLSGVGLYRPDELFFLDYELLEEGIVDLSFAPTLESVPRLSTRQAAAISSGLTFLSQIVNAAEQKEISELLAILGRGARGYLDLPFMVQPASSDEDLVITRRAVAESRAIRCSYRNSNGEVSIREIQPKQLSSREAAWYLRGFCRANREDRIFRVDRMRDIVLLEQFTKLANESDGDQEIYRAKASDTEVLFEVKPEAFSLIADYKPDFEIRGSDSIRVTISIGQIENLGRIVGRYSGKVRVLAPEHARQAVREFALAALGELPKSDEAE